MEKGILNVEKGEIHYHRFGKGNQLLIALHGFADESSLFLKLEKSLSPFFVVYALDLPYHGKTKWTESYFTSEDVEGIVAAVLENEGVERFSYMGYSMGGRIVQKMLSTQINHIDQLFLIAPDGLKTKWMFNVNLFPGWFKVLLKNLLHQPRWFIGMIRKLHQWGIISRFIHNFAYYHIHTQERRDRIFQIWRSIGFFKVNPRKVKTLLRKYPVIVNMYFGTRDEVIPPEAAKLLSNGMANIKVHLIEEGHLLIDEKLDDLLLKQLSKK